MLGLGHIKRKLTGGSSSLERPASPPASPPRTSPHRHASPHGMPPSRQTGAGPVAGQMGQPRIDLQAQRNRTARLDWSVASQLYDHRVISAERNKIGSQMFAQATGSETFVPDRAALDRAVKENLTARANASNCSTEEVFRRTAADPHLKAEYEAVCAKMSTINNQGVSFHRFEMLHIAAENLAARQRAGQRQNLQGGAHQPTASTPAYPSQRLRRQRDESPAPRPGTSSEGAGPSRPQEAIRRPDKEPVQPEAPLESSSPTSPSATGWRAATSRRTRPASPPPPESVAAPVPASPASAGAPSDATGPSVTAGEGPKLSRSTQFQGRRFNAAYAAVRPQGGAEPAAAVAGARRKVQFAEYAVREGIAEKTDGTKGKPAPLPGELRDGSLSEINQQIHRNKIMESQGLLPPDDEDEAETSASSEAGSRRTSEPLTLESFGFSLEQDSDSDTISDHGLADEEAMEVSEEDRAAIGSMGGRMFTRPGVGR